MTSLLHVSDLHVGSTVAICKPVIELDDGDSHHASPGQRWLWEKWNEMIRKVEQYKPIAILNGDIAEGDYKARSYQIITRNKATIQAMATDVLDPLLKVCSKSYVIRGTPAHVGKSAHLEESIAKDIDAVGPSDSVHSWYYLPMKVDRVRVDIAHQTSASGTPLNRAASADRTARRIMEEYMMNGEKAPQLVLRAHVHTFSDSYSRYPVRAIHSPAWTFATDFINRISPGGIADIGYILIHIEGGKMEVEPIRFKPKEKTWVVVK